GELLPDDPPDRRPRRREPRSLGPLPGGQDLVGRGRFDRSSLYGTPLEEPVRRQRCPVAASEDPVRVDRHERIRRSLDGVGRPPEARGGRAAAGTLGFRLPGGRPTRKYALPRGALELRRSARCPTAALPCGKRSRADTVLAPGQLRPALQGTGRRLEPRGSDL